MQHRVIPERPPLRRDIQGLRALAVLLVVGYHVWPEHVTGGFLGVDVFFVISGYLIIGGLVRESGTGHLDLARFYGKRIRRLLPASTLVLVVVSLLTMLVTPAAGWPATMREVVASALQVQNWQLALSSADYVHATAAASPVQHFWSLAVEEQFYLVTPVLLVLVLAAAQRLGGSPQVVRRSLVATIWLATLASFAFSVWYTPDHHTPAYLITPTRIWQLGVGGLLAIHAPRLGPWARRLVGWLGLAVVLWCAAVYSTDLPFPGWVAIVPTLAAAALVAAGPDDPAVRGTAANLLARQPWHYVGDISYSLYLWHWPVIVFALGLLPGGTMPAWAGPVVLVVSLALAALSTRFVEEPFRRPHPSSGEGATPSHGRRPLPVFALGALFVASSLVVSGPAWWWGEQARAEALAATGLDAAHQGFRAATPPLGPSRADRGVPLRPVPAVAVRDTSLSFRDGCDGYEPTRYPADGDHCLYGPKDAPHLAVLVGDSHAGQYSTAIVDALSRHPGWRLKVMNRNGCPFSTEPPRQGGAPFEGCRRHDAAVLRAIEQLKPDLVITSAMSPRSYEQDLAWTWPSHEVMVEGYRTQLAAVRATGADVVVLPELPRPVRPVPACLDRNPNDPAVCDSPRSEALQAGDRPLAEAAARVPGVRVVDVVDAVCGPQVCPAVVGNVVVNRDNHLSDTYVQSLSAWLDPRWRLR